MPTTGKYFNAYKGLPTGVPGGGPAAPLPVAAPVATPTAGVPVPGAGLPGYTPRTMPAGAGNRKGEGQKMSYSLLTLIHQLMQEQAQHGLAMEPQRQALLDKILSLHSTEGLAGLTRWFEGQQMGSAMDEGQNLAGRLMAQGVSSSGAAGAIRDKTNQARSLVNQFKLQNQGIPGQMQAAGTGLGLLAGNQNPDISNFQGLISDVYGKPNAVPHGNPLASLIGTAAGYAFGGPAGGAIGGALTGGGSAGAGVPGSLSGLPGGGSNIWDLTHPGTNPGSFF